MPKYYSEDSRKEYIQIHDERILWEASKDFNDEEYSILIHDILNEYSNDLGCAVYLRGRSARHCCIDVTEYRRYKKAVRLWKEKYRPRILSFIS